MLAMCPVATQATSAMEVNGPRCRGWLIDYYASMAEVKEKMSERRIPTSGGVFKRPNEYFDPDGTLWASEVTIRD